jgi:hypothetical protein
MRAIDDHGDPPCQAVQDSLLAVRFAIKTRPELTTWQRKLDVWVAAAEIEVTAIATPRST